MLAQQYFCRPYSDEWISRCQLWSERAGYHPATPLPSIYPVVGMVIFPVEPVFRVARRLKYPCRRVAN